eukprot:9479263-Pyramimonas_sp.AAC.1
MSGIWSGPVAGAPRPRAQLRVGVSPWALVACWVPRPVGASTLTLACWRADLEPKKGYILPEEEQREDEEKEEEKER